MEEGGVHAMGEREGVKGERRGEGEGFMRWGGNAFGVEMRNYE